MFLPKYIGEYRQLAKSAINLLQANLLEVIAMDTY